MHGQMTKFVFVFVFVLCAVVLGLENDSAQSRSHVEHAFPTQALSAEDLVVVTHMPRDIMRSYGQHTKAINDAYCSRY
jgi:hypothetical protein